MERKHKIIYSYFSFDLVKENKYTGGRITDYMCIFKDGEKLSSLVLISIESFIRVIDNLIHRDKDYDWFNEK